MGTFGSFAETVPTDAFWGPRDVTVDDQGFVYVSDTGNKRIRVYTSTGEYVRDIGAAGSALGQLDEPSGVTTSVDGRLFVADTWNRRVSVFDRDGTALTSYDVRGWYEDLGNRPYVALDEFRHLLYRTLAGYWSTTRTVTALGRSANRAIHHRITASST